MKFGTVMPTMLIPVTAAPTLRRPTERLFRPTAARKASRMDQAASSSVTGRAGAIMEATVCCVA